MSASASVTMARSSSSDSESIAPPRPTTVSISALIMSEPRRMRAEFGMRIQNGGFIPIPQSAIRFPQSGGLLVNAAGEKSAIHHQDFACNEAGRVGNQENCRAGQLFNLAETFHRRAQQEFLPALRFV